MSNIFIQDQKKKDAMLKELGLRMKLARGEARLSQLQVGVIIGVTDKTISSYESGRIAPPIDKLISLSSYFKKPITYFLGGDPKEYRVSARLHTVEAMLKDIRKQLNEIIAESKIKDLDN